MQWAYWLAVPVVATLLAAVGTWLRNRPRPPLSSEETVDDHRGFLAALADATDLPRPR